MSAPSKQATLHRGYLYIFKKHVCFKGLVQEVFPYIAIQDIEKKNFAKIIPNALVIVVKRDGKKAKVRPSLKGCVDMLTNPPAAFVHFV